MIHCLILEDEQPAQEVLLSYIQKTPFLKWKGTFESGLDIPPAELASIDLLFLDIQLSELNGLSFLKTLEQAPKVIVTTAYSNYAVEAFDIAVEDYLLKPFPYERFFKAVSRVRNRLETRGQFHQKNIFLYSNKTFYNIALQDILFLKAEVDYVKVVTEKDAILILDSLRNWKEKLPASQFSQVHRSFILNKNKITKVVGNQAFVKDQVIPIGKTFREDFLRWIQG